MTNDQLRDAVFAAALAPLPVRARALFGGYGLYLDDAFLGVISGARLYFRTDDLTRPDYEDAGMTPLQPAFRPRGPRTVDRNFEVPADVVAHPDQLRAWALRAGKHRSAVPESGNNQRPSRVIRPSGADHATRAHPAPPTPRR
jgi:DNA transformation protein